MLEITRFLLAVLVLISHLSGSKMTDHFGTYAVHGFYVISGYLITLVCRTRYGFSVPGATGFFANRFLRIYPPFYAVSLLTLGAIRYFGTTSLSGTEIQIPTSVGQILSNIFILPLTLPGSPRLIPPMWSVAIELLFYALLFLIFSRSFVLVLLIFLVSVVYTWKLMLSGVSWEFRYFDWRPCALPFAIGACLRFLQERDLLRWLNSRIFAFCIGAFLANVVFMMFLPFENRMDLPFYLNLLIVTVLVASGSHALFGDARLQRVSKYLGKISYPLFLVHWLVGLCIGQFLFHSSQPSLELVAISLPCSVAVAAGIVALVDGPVDRLRERIKRDVKPKSAAPVEFP
jgi:peptidoglycan/LPS O-acetylase OafA/YrhL